MRAKLRTELWAKLRVESWAELRAETQAREPWGAAAAEAEDADEYADMRFETGGKK
jgi:uncharacterized phage-associated protein